MAKEENKTRDPEMVAIGKRVRAARQGRKLTMEQLAERADTSVQFLSQVEKGEQSMTMVKFGRLARALEVSSDYLLFGRDPVNGPAALAAEYMGGIQPVEQDLVAKVLIHIRGLLDEIGPERN